MVTLGRGGSDTTAVALAGAMKADVCEIFTDVEGVYSTDPRVAKRGFQIRRSNIWRKCLRWHVLVQV